MVRAHDTSGTSYLSAPLSILVIPQLNRADKAQEFLMASVILPANPSESRPGRFGVYGGRYVPETLVAALDELEHAYEEAKRMRRSRPS